MVLEMSQNSDSERMAELVRTFQDIQLASAIQALQKDRPQAIQYLQGQKDKVYNEVIKQKNNTIEKVYGDLNRSSKVQESILMHKKRSEELKDLQQQLYEQQENTAKAVIEDKTMAGRKNEMNEWSVNNKYDTLFVLSSLFIMLSGLLLITVLWRMGMISSYLWVALATPLILIFVLIVIRRSKYTDVMRNKRYWNKHNFEGKYAKIPIPYCPEITNAIEGGLQTLQSNVQQGVRLGAQGLASGAQSVASGAQSFASATQQNIPL
jgi:hypothetical protein